ncbi:mannosyltransferase [Ascidiimonas sp. W6]|uniref:mannosyltransferase n=1 Tax=Ascidiimonas meishanensis TaxID=3128903 RepID=UPI0030EB21A8
MALTSIVLYFSFAYDLQRTDFIKLITLYGALFYFYYTLIKVEKTQPVFLNALVILSRMVFLFAIPNLSQDFYRFIWDGRMLVEGWNPFLYLPKTLMEEGIAPVAQAQELYKGMGELSANHYTNYPPLNQLCFFIAALFSGNSILGSVLTLRIIIIISDLGILYVGQKLLRKLELPDHYIYLYLLNPFIIIELTGNLHFESLMLFFLLLSLYLIVLDKTKLAALAMACSISVKLLPLLLLPLLFQRLSFKKAIIFYSLSIFITILLFTPFFSIKFIESYTETIGLWFTNFEFNGSIYNIIKAIGFKVSGYNIIRTVGKITPLIVLFLVILLTFLRDNKSLPKLITGMLFALSFYLFTASVVHPWYLSTLLLLSIFTKYRYPFLWSLLIMLSYFTYSQPNFTESYLLLVLQYLPVYALCIYEIFISRKKIAFNL